MGHKARRDGAPLHTSQRFAPPAPSPVRYASVSDPESSTWTTRHAFRAPRMNKNAFSLCLSFSASLFLFLCLASAWHGESLVGALSFYVAPNLQYRPHLTIYTRALFEAFFVTAVRPTTLGAALQHRVRRCAFFAMTLRMSARTSTGKMTQRNARHTGMRVLSASLSVAASPPAPEPDDFFRPRSALNSLAPPLLPEPVTRCAKCPSFSMELGLGARLSSDAAVCSPLW
mmetsp:Transcript_34251/g.108002  ORF Transcript_34251/g.108002 Transcript_34251/m.108002 type:complete len:229 (+) Transcript_34251:1464-2150(+)